MIEGPTCRGVNSIVWCVGMSDIQYGHFRSQQNDGMDLDDILPQVGEFGTYQKLMLWLVCLPACFPCGFGAFNQLFMANIADHWCKVPLLSNLSFLEQRNLSIPFNNGTYDNCRRYSVNWTQILEDSGGTFKNVVVNESWSTEYCQDGWIYDRTLVESSIVIDVSF